MFSKLERKIKTWTAATLPIRWIEPYIHGGDCLVFSSDPLIIYTPDWVIRDQPFALLPVLRQFRHKVVHLLINLSWTHENPSQIKQAKLLQARYLRRFPCHRIIFMANSETEQHMLAKAGLKTVWVNQNIFVSPTIFRILPESEKRFDAIYDARISSFKRHKLAAEIASLALITARVPYHHNESYIHSIKLILPQAYWFNDPLATDYQWMSLSEINAAINQCRVGLCLSAEEGAMFASMQYLLAGLPIVSTASRGGRNEFFSPDYVRIVADSVEAIAAGVREMSNCPVPPGEIRRRTLEKVERHKTRLFELLDSICSDKHWRVNMRSSWNSWMHSPNSIATPAAIRNRIERAATITTASPL